MMNNNLELSQCFREEEIVFLTQVAQDGRGLEGFAITFTGRRMTLGQAKV
jgi:hypothetical protein